MIKSKIRKVNFSDIWKKEKKFNKEFKGYAKLNIDSSGAEIKSIDGEISATNDLNASRLMEWIKEHEKDLRDEIGESQEAYYEQQGY